MYSGRSFETLASLAPQDEVSLEIKGLPHSEERLLARLEGPVETFTGSQDKGPSRRTL